MKSWLKGGLLGAGIYLVLFIILLVIDDLGLITAIISPGTWFIIGISGVSANIKYFLQFIISIIGWFILGSLIGFIIGKIKSKKEE